MKLSLLKSGPRPEQNSLSRVEWTLLIGSGVPDKMFQVLPGGSPQTLTVDLEGVDGLQFSG